MLAPILFCSTTYTNPIIGWCKPQVTFSGIKKTFFFFPRSAKKPKVWGAQATKDPGKITFYCAHTLFEIFIFCPKIQLWFPEKIVDFFGWKTRENVVVLDLLAADNFDFTRRIVKKNLGENFVKMLGFWKNWTFGQKFDFSNSVRSSSCLPLLFFSKAFWPRWAVVM